MRTIIILFLIFMPHIASAVNQQDTLMISVFFNRGQVGIKSIEIGTGNLPGEKTVDKNSPSYWIELIAENGEVLIRKEFNIYLQLVSELFSEDESATPEASYIHLDETTSVVIMPYYKNIKWLNLYDANLNLIEKQDVAYLSQVCGNGICQNNENSDTCSSDCSKTEKDGYCSPALGISDPDCVKNVEAEKQIKSEIGSSKITNKQMYLIFGIFLCLLFGLLFLVYFLMVKNKKTKNGQNNNDKVINNM